jgi:hypothetical protein
VDARFDVPEREVGVAELDAVENHVPDVRAGIHVALDVDESVRSGGDDFEGVRVHARRGQVVEASRGRIEEPLARLVEFLAHALDPEPTSGDHLRVPLAVGHVDSPGPGIHLGDRVPLVEEAPLGHDVDLGVTGAAPRLLHPVRGDEDVIGVAANGIEKGIRRIGVWKAGAGGAASVHEQLAEIPTVRAHARRSTCHTPSAPWLHFAGIARPPSHTTLAPGRLAKCMGNRSVPGSSGRSSRVVASL